MRRSLSGPGPVQVPMVGVTNAVTIPSVATVSATNQCRLQVDMSINDHSSRPPPTRPSALLHSSSSTAVSSLIVEQLPPRGASRHQASSVVLKRAANGTANGGGGSSGSRTNGHRLRLMTCVTGQRSPTSPEKCGTIADSMNGDVDGYVSDRLRRRVSSSSLSLENSQSDLRRPPLPTAFPPSEPTSTPPVSPLSASAAAAAAAAVGRRLSTSGVSTAMLASANGSGNSVAAGPGDESATQTRGRSRETGSKSERKKRVVSDRSPAALWRSISSSSLVRSLSRRRTKNVRRSMTGGLQESGGSVNGGGSSTSDDCRSKMSSSVDTEDSDADIIDAESGSRRSRRPTNVDDVGGSSTGLMGERRRSDAAIVVDTMKTCPRRRSFFSRSFRRSRSTPAEEFVTIASSGAGSPSGKEKAETDRLPRKRLSCRNIVVSANDVNRSTLSSRAASWASLKRSVTSDSLSSVNKGHHGSTGSDMANGRGGVYVVAVNSRFDVVLRSK
jgi:hypothetical protein